MIINEIAVFGGGCFWCTEAIFKNLRGVKAVTSGYAGGAKKDPSYEEVSAGKTGHAEVVRIEFDPAAVSYETLLEIFFNLHDPTTPDRQGADVGPQYRSIILYLTPEQETAAKKYIERLNERGTFGKPVVTELKPLDEFYPAEEPHQDYYGSRPNQPYCRLVISPKLKKLRESYGKLLS